MSTPTPRTYSFISKLLRRLSEDHGFSITDAVECARSFQAEMETELTAALARVGELENETSAARKQYFKDREAITSLTRQLSETQAQLASAREDGERFCSVIQAVIDSAVDPANAKFASMVPLTPLRSAIDAARGVSSSCNQCDGLGVIPKGDSMNLHQTGNAEFGEAPCPDCAETPASATVEPASTTPTVILGFYSYRDRRFGLIIRDETECIETTLQGSLLEGQFETVSKILPTCVFVKARIGTELLPSANNPVRREAVQGWQPIETAPRDGTHLLLWDESSQLAISGLWYREPGMNNPNGYEPAWAWWVADGDLILWDSGNGPTHWQPLPPPPTGEEGK